MALKIGIIRDDRFFEHLPGPTHPEHPSRLNAVYRMLDNDFAHDLLLIRPEPATLEALELVHTPAYIKKVLKTADHRFTSLAPDTPASAKTYVSAWLAVGGCLKGLESLVAGQCDICFALVRPPGHHALADRAGGFCIFNNLGITARYAQHQFGFQRILIIDWDIHHGNGIQEIFYKERKVLYFSTHDMLLYPYTGNWEEIGQGRGEGYNINIPITRELRDADFLHIYREVLTAIGQRYVPDLILVVAGFDAHHEDPIGRSKLTESVFAELAKVLLDLRALANDAPILLALEGGYSGRGAAKSIKGLLEVLASGASPQPYVAAETPAGTRLLNEARRIHSVFNVWLD